MTQIYHNNASTNCNIRNIIQSSSLSSSQLAITFGISVNTANKWKKRDFLHDKSSRPDKIHYSLNEIEKQVIISIRKSTWMSFDDIDDICKTYSKNINRSNIYRTCRQNNIHKIPEEKKREAKKFKEYQPGFLHIDVTYLPKIVNKRKYLFVAIDRATRTLFVAVYNNKTAKNAKKFLQLCLDYFPFKITHILTDNGTEFTNKFIAKKLSIDLLVLYLLIRSSKLIGFAGCNDLICSSNTEGGKS